MILDLKTYGFNFIRMYACTDDQSLLVKLQKNLKDSSLLDVTRLLFEGSLDIEFEQADITYSIENNEQFVELKIPFNSIAWNVLNINNIKCLITGLTDVPLFLEDKFRSSKKVTDLSLLKDQECFVNDYRFIPAWIEPIRYLDIDVESDGSSTPVVDMNRYDLTNYDEITIWCQFEFDVINVPVNFKVEHVDKQGLALYLTPNIKSKDKFTIYLPGEIPENRNLIRLIRIS